MGIYADKAVRHAETAAYLRANAAKLREEADGLTGDEANELRDAALSDEWHASQEARWAEGAKWTADRMGETSADRLMERHDGAKGRIF